MSSDTFNIPRAKPLPGDGPNIPLYLPSTITDPSPLLSFQPFTNWLNRLQTQLSKQTESDHPFYNNPYHLQSVTLHSITFPGNNPYKPVLFAQVSGSVQTADGKEHLPAIAFLRGGSVAILVILTDEETGEEWCPLTVQPRIPIGNLGFTEVPAGMLDGSGNFKGVAAQELKEEVGLEIKEDELVDLGERAWGKSEDLEDAVYPSPGGCDEYIRMFVTVKKVKKEEIESMKGKLTGLRDGGEKITLKIVKRDELWKSTRDGKLLSILALWEGLKREKESEGEKTLSSYELWEKLKDGST